MNIRIYYIYNHETSKNVAICFCIYIRKLKNIIIKYEIFNYSKENHSDVPFQSMTYLQNYSTISFYFTSKNLESYVCNAYSYVLLPCIDLE